MCGRRKHGVTNGIKKRVSNLNTSFSHDIDNDKNNQTGFDCLVN